MSKPRDIAKAEPAQVALPSQTARAPSCMVYRVTNRIRHNGRDYESGDLIELCGNDAERLKRFSCITEV